MSLILSLLPAIQSLSGHTSSFFTSIPEMDYYVEDMNVSGALHRGCILALKMVRQSITES